MKRGRLLLILLILAAAGTAGWYWLIHKPAGTTQATQAAHGQRPRPGSAEGDPIPVLAAAAITQDVPIYLDALGTVQAFYTVNVKAMIDGPLTAVLFKEGQDVKTGDVLAHIDPRPYQAALDQALGKKAQDEANLANARVDLARYQKLVASQYTSGQTADTQKSTVAQLVAQIQQDQAQIDTARTNLSYTTIQSPIDGRTGIRQVDPGNIVHAADTTPLVTIAELRPISVIFNLPQQTLPLVAAAMARGSPEVLALPQGVANDGNTVLDRGEVAVLDNAVDQSTGTIKLKATFPNQKLLLWPGGFVNVRLLVETQPNVVTVPPVAVQRGPAGAYVYLVRSNNTVERRTIQVGHEDESVAVVLAGLRPGDRVVTDGASRLMEGSRITVQDGSVPPVATDQDNRPRAPGQGRQRASAAP